MTTITDITNRVLADVLSSTSLDSALYADNSLGLPDNVGGDEFPSIRQNVHSVPMSPEEVTKSRAFGRQWMKDNWGVTDAELDAPPHRHDLDYCTGFVCARVLSSTSLDTAGRSYQVAAE